MEEIRPFKTLSSSSDKAERLTEEQKLEADRVYPSNSLCDFLSRSCLSCSFPCFSQVPAPSLLYHLSSPHDPGSTMHFLDSLFLDQLRKANSLGQREDTALSISCVFLYTPPTTHSLPPSSHLLQTLYYFVLSS